MQTGVGTWRSGEGCGAPDIPLEAEERGDTSSYSEACLQEPCPARGSGQGVRDLRRTGLDAR